MGRLVGLLFVLGVLGAGVGAGVVWTFANQPASPNARDVVVDVRSGSVHSVAKLLSGKGLISSPELFIWLVRMKGASSRIRAGEFQFNMAMTPLEVLTVLIEGKAVLHPVTVKEGDSIFEVAATIEKLGLGEAEEFLKLARSPEDVKALIGIEAESIEGYLFPETYNFVRDTSMKTIISTMTDMFKKRYAELGPQAKKSRLSRHEQVILASMIEKETGAPEERPMIASVFFNRLAKKMKLQSDPTIMYGLQYDMGIEVTNITREHLRWENRFSTYSTPALPAGPIGSPGLEALRAVLNPATSDYLFFVSKNDGTHSFSATLGGHNAAVKEFQLDRKAREGKSWRDRLKNEKPKPL